VWSKTNRNKRINEHCYAQIIVNSTIKKSSQIFLSLQATRGIAALMVVLFHISGIIGAEKYFDFPEIFIPYAFAGSGVNMFFVLSGFVIYSTHQHDFGRPEKFLAFLKKRIIRIYPIYWIIFFGVASIALIYPGYRHQVPSEIIVWIKSIFLLPQNQSVVGGTGAPVIEVAWTLQVEIVFYAIVGLFILGSRFAIIFLGLLFTAFLFKESFESDYVRFLLAFIFQPHMVFLFGVGVVTGWISNVITVDAKLGKCLVWLAGIIFCVAWLDLFSISWINGEKIYIEGTAFAIFIFGAISLERAGHVIWRGGLYQKLGKSSYALYLVHYPLVVFLAKLMSKFGLPEFGIAGLIFALGIALVGSVLAGWGIHSYIEAPLTQFLRGWVLARQKN
jgi:exopolysaccharide production protein ExoZ